MKSLFALVVALLAPQAAAASDAETGAPVVVELFTSQSCSSCVAAAAYFEELAERDDVVALAWHVDYWNTLQTRRGRWVDPYSSADNTERQRLYNRNLRRTSGVYTPQMVVGGAAETVGSARGKVERLIDLQKTRADSAEILASRTDDVLSIQVTGTGEAHVVYFTPSARTDVSGGENAGVNFANSNSVSTATMLGPVDGKAAFTAAPPADGQRCAILLQAPNQGRMIAARYCPEA